MTEEDSSGVISPRRARIGRESLNLPNLITISRLALAVVLFAMIDAGGWPLVSARSLWVAPELCEIGRAWAKFV